MELNWKRKDWRKGLRDFLLARTYFFWLFLFSVIYAAVFSHFLFIVKCPTPHRKKRVSFCSSPETHFHLNEIDFLFVFDVFSNLNHPFFPLVSGPSRDYKKASSLSFHERLSPRHPRIPKRFAEDKQWKSISQITSENEKWFLLSASLFMRNIRHSSWQSNNYHSKEGSDREEISLAKGCEKWQSLMRIMKARMLNQ